MQHVRFAGKIVSWISVVARKLQKTPASDWSWQLYLILRFKRLPAETQDKSALLQQVAQKKSLFTDILGKDRDEARSTLYGEKETLLKEVRTYFFSYDTLARVILRKICYVALISLGVCRGGFWRGKWHLFSSAIGSAEDSMRMCIPLRFQIYHRKFHSGDTNVLPKG